MAQGFTDFTGATVGADPPSGWTARGDASAAWRVGAGPVVEWEDTDNRFDFLTWDAAGSVSGDIEIFGEFESTSGSGGQGGLCLQVQASGLNGYYAGFALGGLGFDEVFTNVIVGGVEGGAGVGAAFPWAINTPQRIRLRKLSSDNILRVRAWLATDPEPGTWTVSLGADTSFTSGYVGLFARNLSGVKTWRKFGYGTAGDPAPTAPLNGGLIRPFIAPITGVFADQPSLSGTGTVS
jgi:hypothetical protein